jgi:chromosome segregation ATPase
MVVNQQPNDSPVVEQALLVASEPLPTAHESAVPELLRIGASTTQIQQILDSDDAQVHDLNAEERALMRAIIMRAMVDHERVLLNNNTAMVTLASNLAEINRTITDLQQRKLTVQRSIDEINSVQQNVAAQIEKIRDRVEHLDALQAGK